jgi:hypothetical protein
MSDVRIAGNEICGEILLKKLQTNLGFWRFDLIDYTKKPETDESFRRPNSEGRNVERCVGRRWQPDQPG